MADWDLCTMGDDFAAADVPYWFFEYNWVTVVAGRNGGNALRFQGTSYAKRAIPGGVRTDLIVAFAVRVSKYVAGRWFFTLGDALGSNLHLKMFADGSIQMSRCSNTVGYRDYSSQDTDLGSPSAAGVLVANQWVSLEIHVVYHNSTGSIEIRKSGTTVYSVPVADTCATGTTGATYVKFYQGGGGGDDLIVDFDDYAIGDTFVGDSRIDAQMPIADVQADWTPSSGTDLFEMVNDSAPDEAGTTLSSSTVGHKCTFQVEALKNAGNDVISRQIAWVGNKANAGTSSVGGVLTHEGSDTDYDGQAMSTSIAGYQQMLAGCTEAEFNADRYGLKKVA